MAYKHTLPSFCLPSLIAPWFLLPCPTWIRVPHCPFHFIDLSSCWHKWQEFDNQLRERKRRVFPGLCSVCQLLRCSPGSRSGPADIRPLHAGLRSGAWKWVSRSVCDFIISSAFHNLLFYSHSDISQWSPLLLWLPLDPRIKLQVLNRLPSCTNQLYCLPQPRPLPRFLSIWTRLSSELHIPCSPAASAFTGLPKCPAMWGSFLVPML